MIKVREKIELSGKKRITLVLALANKIMKEINFVEVINECVDWDKARWGISPGGLAKALIMSTFTDLRSPLTHIQERLLPMDLSYLLGEEAQEHEINAFNVGRALERIGEAGCDRQYETLALSALQRYQISTKRMHSDTTTISFYGEYDVAGMKLTEEEEKEMLQIERGYNKDGRPESKQVVVGQIVNEYGIPLINRTLDGATADVEWNKRALEYLENLREKGFKEGIYVADSKLVTQELVNRMNSAETGVSFVSRCPSNFEKKLEARMIERAYAEENWEELGEIGAGKKASHYRCKSFTESICGGMLRLLVLESSALLEKTEAAVEKEKSKLMPLVREVEKKEFACAADAEQEYSRFKKLKELRLFEPRREIVETVKEHWPRGRRSASTKPTVTRTYQIRVTQIARNEAACQQYIHTESSFVLLSNVTDGSIEDRELLEIYKGQYVVENSFRQLKGPNLASVIYLKNPKRIQALTMLLSFSLLLRAIIQYRLREGLKIHQQEHPGITINAGWGGKALANPTFKLLFEHSINCQFERVDVGEYSFAWPDVETKERVLPLLSLMGLTLVSLLE